MSSIRLLYKDLVEKLVEISHLNSASALLSWDQSVFMKPGSAEARGKHIGTLAAVIHEKETDTSLGTLIHNIYSHPNFTTELDEWEIANVRDALRSFDKQTNIPKDLSKQIAELQSTGYETWVDARNKSDWKLFEPVLENWVSLIQKVAKHTDPTKLPYDVALDDFERGMTTEKLETIFTQLKSRLIPLIQKIENAKKQGKGPNQKLFDGKLFDVTKQEKLNVSLAENLGFDLNCGRLDVSVHPFTTSFDPTDVRITTRYNQESFVDGLMGTIHETGHALYELSRPLIYADLPVSQPVSMGIHESQSLLWERIVGLSKNFCAYIYQQLKETFPEEFSCLKTDEELYAYMNSVNPGYIRVDSDEVTYAMHIILRFELERDLINGKIKASDVPMIWNNKMKEYLGINIVSDKEGALQDVHWGCGLYGYFPSYALGAIYSFQLFEAAKKDLPDLEIQIRNGQFNNLKEWLRIKIHSVGSLIPDGYDLVEKITGKGLDIDEFVNHLNKKYGEIYGF